MTIIIVQYIKIKVNIIFKKKLKIKNILNGKEEDDSAKFSEI